MIYHISPYRSDRNIGRANNDMIRLLPDDSWICLTDHDSCFLLPESGTHIEMVVEQYGNEFDLIGCTTNRLGSTSQLYKGVFDSECNAYKNYNDALKAWDKYGTSVEPIDLVAGVFMLFKKSTWEKVGRFEENHRMADVLFNKAVKKNGGKIGLAKGIYIQHNYRLWQTEMKKAKTSYKHLVK